MARKLSFYKRTGFHNFDEVYQTYHERIKGYVQKRIRNYSDVEDIVQQTFLAFLKKKDDFVSQQKNAVEKYLYTIARNKTINHFRSETTERRKKRRLEEEFTVSQFSGGEFTYVDEEGEEKLIQKIKTILPENYWQVFLPRVFEGCSYQEIGERLGISASNAGQRQFRAKKKLRSVWKKTLKESKR